MARKPRDARTIQVFGNGTAGTTASGTMYSRTISHRSGSASGFHIAYGAITGTLTLWASDHPSPDEADDDDWAEVESIDVTSPAGVAGKDRYDFSGIGARWVRWKYVHGSGTGTIAGWTTQKYC